MNFHSTLDVEAGQIENKYFYVSLTSDVFYLHNNDFGIYFSTSTLFFLYTKNAMSKRKNGIV